VKSNLHIQSLIRNRENFNKLNEIFERIDGFWKEKIIKKPELNLNKMSLGDEFSSIGMILDNINTTDSISNLTCGLIIDNKGKDDRDPFKNNHINVEEKYKSMSNNVYSQIETPIQQEIISFKKKKKKKKLKKSK